MSYNGTGTFNINTAGQPVVTGTVISSTAFNALTADLATGLSTAITKDGQTTVTANIPFNNFKLTGIAAATATGDALSYGRAATVTTLVASTSITDSGLTSGRVTYAGTAGLLQDSANLTFDGTYFTANSIKNSALTSGRVTYAGASGLLSDSVGLTWDGTTFAASNVSTGGSVTLSGGTANGVLYLNGSKVATSGSALTFDGTNFGTSTSALYPLITVASSGNNAIFGFRLNNTGVGGIDWRIEQGRSAVGEFNISSPNVYGSSLYAINAAATAHYWSTTSGEQMRLTSTGLGIGTSSPAYRLDVATTGQSIIQIKAGTTTDDSILAFGDSAANAVGRVNYSHSVDAMLFYTSSAEKMRLDSSGNLGLGVTPSAWGTDYKALQIGGGASASLSYKNFVTSLSQNVYSTNANDVAVVNGNAAKYELNGSGQHVWKTAAVTAGNTISFTQAMTLDASGNLGLGVTPSAWGSGKALEIGSVIGNAFWGGNANSAWIFSNAYYDGSSYRYAQTSYANLFRVGAGNGEFQWFTAPSGTAGNAITFTQAMTLDASGNLGVGTTLTSGYKLNIGAGDGNNAIAIDSWTIAKYSGTDIRFGGVNASNWTTLSLYTGGSERARVDSSGNLLVGKTSSLDTVAGFGIGSGGTCASTAAATTDSTVTFAAYSTGASAYRFYVGFGGTVYATNTTISAISDQRFKENIRDLDVGLSAVMALKPRKFDWKAGKGKDIKNDRGFIAQEFEQVFPDLIDEWKDPAPEGEEPYKSVRQDLIPVLVKAIQEQQSLITDLRTRVSQLEKGA
jgi:hypothetical protein